MNKPIDQAIADDATGGSDNVAVNGTLIRESVRENIKKYMGERPKQLEGTFLSDFIYGRQAMYDQIMQNFGLEDGVREPEWCEHIGKITKDGSGPFFLNHKDYSRKSTIEAHPFYFCPICGAPRPESEPKEEPSKPKPELPEETDDTAGVYHKINQIIRYLKHKENE